MVHCGVRAGGPVENGAHDGEQGAAGGAQRDDGVGHLEAFRLDPALRLAECERAEGAERDLVGDIEP